MSPPRSAGPLLAVKHAIPAVRDSVLARDRLERRLDQDARLTLVAAPAGWGKTSLVSRWAARRATEQAVAWVSLDEGDDEPTRFWSYVFAGLRDATASIGFDSLDALAAGDGPISAALPLLLNELAAMTSPLVIILDDYHVITHPEIHESLEFLISHLPAHVHVVIGTRMDPPLPLARMRVRGELVEVRATDLQFSAGESLALLSSVSRSEVDPAAVEPILERTEGWAAGLQLAGLALSGATGWSGAAGDRAGVGVGDQRHLFDYFAAEVLPSFAPEQRDLLVRAAPLELLSGSLCDAALGVSGSGTVLGELERAGLFVVALDHEGEWYRCHQLLRSALGWSALAEPDAATQDVLRRAAQWYIDHDRMDDAIRALRDARDYPGAVALIQSQRLWFTRRGWGRPLLELAASFPEDQITSAAALVLSYVATTCGMEDRIQHWLALAVRNARPDSTVGGWGTLRAAELTVRGTYTNLFTDGPATQEMAVAMFEEAVALEAEAGIPDHPIAMIGLADAYGFAGRFEEAASIFARFWDGRESIPLTETIALQTVGQLLLFLDLSGSSDALDHYLPEAVAAADAIEDAWGPAAAGPLIVMTRIIQGRRSYERGDLPAAAAELARGLWSAELNAHPLWRVLALVFLADLRLAMGDRPGAREALVGAREIVDTEVVAAFIRELLEAAENRIGRAAARTATTTGRLHEELTDRELSILRMLPGTATQREIGAALYLSINTVKGYNKSLYRKLGVGGRAEAVQVARETGLI